MSDPGEPDLARRFRRLIERHGPMPVSRFMGESNALYYASRDPLGSAGDFTTAPEISQMFGELVGLWLVDIWSRAGRPDDCIYVELGPGRGTLCKDALRVMRGQGFDPALHLVEGSPALRKLQAAALGHATHHDDLSTLPDHAPMLLVANEFLDALPVRQLVLSDAGWRERMVGLLDDEFAFVAGDQPMREAVPPEMLDSPPGAIIETCPGAAAAVEEISLRLRKQGGAALLIDYGDLERKAGSTLQAVHTHRKVDPLTHPGIADLTALVDFQSLAEIAQRNDVRVQTETQGAWLQSLGIALRAKALAALHPERIGELEAAHARLVGSEQMGALFKVMALTPPGWPEGVGLPVAPRSGSE